MDTTIFFWFNSAAGMSALGDRIIVFTAEYLPFVLGAIIVGWIAAGAYSRRQKLELLAFSVFAGLLARFGFGTSLRFLFRRPRPFLTLNAHQLLVENTYSFPSGHALFLFGAATLLFLHNRKLGAVAFGFSTLICLARIAAGVHYPSDILGGAALGILAAVVTYRFVEPFKARLIKK